MVAGHAMRRLGRALTGPLRAFRPGARRGAAERLVIAPQDLRTSDPTIASDIYAGYFAFAGKVVTPGGRSPFQAMPPTPAWAQALMGFGWLRHLRAADSALARANARALVDDWIAYCSRPRVGPAWQPAVVARRLISWLSQSPLILEGADRAFYRRFMRSLARQASVLARDYGGEARAQDRLLCAIALVEVALCTGASGPSARRAARLLSAELDAQILPDGGHVCRNPQALLDILLDLLPLRQAYASQGVEPPRALLNAIDRILPALRLFRHGDGSLALFNGMGATSHDALATVLAYSHARAAALENAPHSGYQRLRGEATVVVMDTGAPPPRAESGDAHAGCLSFEFSDGAHPVVVNCGAPAPGNEDWRQAARATAAHSTLALADTSSCRFVAADGIGALLGTPVLAGPERVAVQREAGGADGRGVAVLASHDGYVAAFGVVHQRRVEVDGDGGAVRGEDRLIVSHSGRARRAPSDYAIRFHLHPSVRVVRAAGGRSAFLRLPGGAGWTFSAGGLPLAVEESVYFATAEGPRACEQIVVAADFRETPEIAWSFERADEPPRAPAGEPEPPLI
nr:heparinase II/III family protein [Alsobacter ponti]